MGRHGDPVKQRGTALKVHVIANPWSGRKHRPATATDLAAALTAAGHTTALHLTERRGHATIIAQRIRDDADLVVIVGGDGTAHEVINGLMPSAPAVVILPSGTGNDYASLVAAPRSPQQLVETIHRGLAVRADVVAFDGRYAINSLGLGFEGIVNRYSQSMTRLRGTALYLAAVFKALSNLRCPNFELHTAEGRRIAGPHLMISIGNGVRTGGGFYLTPEACADDGLLDLCVVAPLGRARVLALLPKSLRGGHVGHPAVTMLRSERVAVTSEPGLPMHADGELIDPAPARMTLTVLPRTLRVLTTAEHPPHFLHAAERIL